MSYSHVQCIGYKINTLELDKKNNYLGAVSTIDINNRCTIMKNAMLEALAKASEKNDSNCLKIFMAPEFFFRDANGAYPIEAVSSIMETLREQTNEMHFKDWLFIFGTAIAYLTNVDSKEVFNIAMVQSGWTKSVDFPPALIVYKEYVSHMDFIRDKANKWGKNRRALIGRESWWSFLLGRDRDMSLLRPTEGSRDLESKKINKVGKGKEKTKSGLGGQGYFEMKGVHFGLEICLDHFKSRLRASPPEKGDFYPQIHLIPSGGASIQEESIACGNKGIIFNVDARHTALNCNKGTFVEPKAKYKDGTGKLISIPPEKFKLKEFQGSNKYFKDLGYLEIYPRLPIPEKVKVTA